MICFNFLKPSQRLRHSGRSRGREFDAGLSSSSFFLSFTSLLHLKSVLIRSLQPSVT